MRNIRLEIREARKCLGYELDNLENVAHKANDEGLEYYYQIVLGVIDTITREVREHRRDIAAELEEELAV